MNIYAAEFNFDPVFPFSINPYLLKMTDNVRNTYHWHSCFEFTYIRHGEAIYYIGEKSYSVKSGDFILFNPAEYHGWEVLCDTMEAVVMLFPMAFVRECMMNYYGLFLKSFLEQGGYYKNYIGSSDTHANELCSLFLSVEDEFIHKNPGFQLVIQTDVLKILTLLTRHYVRSGVSTGDFTVRAGAAKRMEPAIQYIYYNFAEKITMENMAQLCCMSPSYFSVYFKKACGCSFIHYLNGIRIRQARKQLLITDKDILTISLDCGFTNLSNFYRIYEKYTGNTPGMERKAKPS